MARLLITGASGQLGSVLRDAEPRLATVLRLFDRQPIEALKGEELVLGDIRNLDDMMAATDGIDAVVHLAGIPTEPSMPSDASVAELMDTNIRGTYNVFESARRSGCARVVFASTNHVTGYHPVQSMIGPETSLAPDSYYAVTKTFGEALGRLYHDKYGLDVICIRIGSCRRQPLETRHLSTWLSYGDFTSLVRCCLTARGLGYLVTYGVSANTRTWWLDPSWERLGYRPQDNAEDFAERFHATELFRFQGGAVADAKSRSGY